MTHHRANNSPHQHTNSVRGVKHLAHAVGVAPYLMRKWLRRKYGRRRRGDWQWRFTDREVALIAREYGRGDDA